jgi:hypothetical protein
MMCNALLLALRTSGTLKKLTISLPPPLPCAFDTLSDRVAGSVPTPSTHGSPLSLSMAIPEAHQTPISTFALAYPLPSPPILVSSSIPAAGSGVCSVVETITHLSVSDVSMYYHLLAALSLRSQQQQQSDQAHQHPHSLLPAHGFVHGSLSGPDLGSGLDLGGGFGHRFGFAAPFANLRYISIDVYVTQRLCLGEPAQYHPRSRSDPTSTSVSTAGSISPSSSTSATVAHPWVYSGAGLGASVADIARTIRAILDENICPELRVLVLALKEDTRPMLSARRIIHRLQQLCSELEETDGDADGGVRETEGDSFDPRLVFVHWAQARVTPCCEDPVGKSKGVEFIDGTRQRERDREQQMDTIWRISEEAVKEQRRLNGMLLFRFIARLLPPLHMILIACFES